MSYRKKVTNKRKGFTLIEVAIFLAISGALFVMVIANTAARVTSRRYYDAVNDLAEELRNAYSATINVENYRRNKEDVGYYCSISSAFIDGKLTLNSYTKDTKVVTDNLPGRTRCAIYGQLITFGEESNNDDIDDRSIVHRYEIIGLAKTDNIEPTGEDDILAALGSNDNAVYANVVTIRNTAEDFSSPCKAYPAGNNYTYMPQWKATIENKKDRNLYRGAIMIARSPISGTIHTFLYSYYQDPSVDNPSNDDTFMISRYIENKNKSTNSCESYGYSGDSGLFIQKAITENKWIMDSDEHIDLCIGGQDSIDNGDKRRAIRIHGDGSTEAAIEVLPEGESNEVCKLEE